MNHKETRQRIVRKLKITNSMVAVLLPYERIVYDVPGKTKNVER